MAKLRVDKIASVGVSTETTGSVFFDGSGDYLAAPVSSDFEYGTGDFTIECFVYFESFPSTFAPIVSLGRGASGGGAAVLYVAWQIYYDSSAGNLNFYRYDGSTTTHDFSVTLSTNTWYHIAVSRSGTSLRCFVNGTQVGSTVTTSLSYNKVDDDNLQIGHARTGSGGSTSNWVNGYISNLRICKGHAVYKSNFAVPTRELDVHQGPDDDRTVLLCCYDGENIFADKSGRHIISAYGDRLSSPTPTATDSPIGITTLSPGLVRDVDNTFGPSFQGGVGYTSQNWLTLPKGTTTDRFPNFAGVDAASARGVFMGGGNTPRVNTIDYVTISTLGDATDFGDLSAPNFNHAGGASDTRGISAGGTNPSNTNLIEYITIQSTGNAQDFGDLSAAKEQMGGASNSTRCIFAGGYTTEHINTIDFITISTLGNTFDFGDLTAVKRSQGGLASPTRALFAAGVGPGVSVNIDYVSIMSTGNAVDFGDISGNGGRQGPNGCSTNTRGCWGGGYNGPAGTDAIQYVTIATLGNAQPFGDLSVATLFSAATSSSTRGVWGGGYKPAVSNTIEYITMATLGDANNFGDLSQARQAHIAASNGHGGLG